MFICGKCKRKVGPGIPQARHVTGEREVTYPLREYRFKKETRFDSGGKGLERIGEIALCPFCALESDQPENRAERLANLGHTFVHTKTEVMIRPRIKSE